MLLTFLKFLFPVSIWLFLFRGILSGSAPILREPFAVYAMVKFYLDHLRLGVFPLWNPFLLGGFPLQIILNYFGSSNPLWLLTLVLNYAGVSMYYAFLSTVVIYFLIGQMGFYFLAKSILKDPRAAYIAFLFSLFSSTGMVQIAQFNMLLIYVPAVWFFYFLVRFCRRWDRVSWIGMIFTLMLIAQAYLPFYFITVLALAALIFALVNPGQSKTILIGFFHFGRRHAVLVGLTSVILMFSLVPAYLAYRSTAAHEVVVSWRQDTPDVFTKGAAFAQYKRTTEGGLSSRMSPDDLFSNLDQLVYGNDGFFYVSGFAFLILLMGAFNQINRRIVFLSLLFVGLFILTIENSTPVHQFLFDHVFYFKLFRNMHFFLPFLLAVFVLLTAEQARLLLQWPLRLASGQRGWALAIVILVHAGCWMFLLGRENIIKSSYDTIVLSFLFCVIALLHKPSLNRYGQPLLLFLCVVFQPIYVIWGHNQLATENFSPTLAKGMIPSGTRPQFSFSRPDSQLPGETPGQKVDDFYWYYLSMTDAPLGYMASQQGFPVFWSYYVFRNFPEDVAREYFKNKFVVYDAVDLYPAESMEFSSVIAALREKTDVAFVAADQDRVKDELAGFIKKRPAFSTQHAQFINSPLHALEVRHFDANTIRFTTDFKEEKFLVYNDSFMRGWEARRNGLRVPLYCANVAFKGLRLPAGHNEIELAYRPAEGGWLVTMLVLYSGVFLFLLTVAFLQFRRGQTGCPGVE